MSKTRKKQQKAVARRKTKQKESAARRQRAKEDPIVVAMRRAAHWELASCTISRNWQSSLEAIISVARKSPLGAFAVAVFIVDLGCSGVVTAIANPEMAGAQFERFTQASAEGSEPTELEHIAALLDTAVRYAAGLGMQPHPDYEAAARLLGTVDPNAWPRPIVCGRNGKPWFDPTPGQDAAAIARTLRTHVGPFGFSGSSDPFPDDLTPDRLDASALSWHERAARADVLMTALLRFARSDRMLDERTSYLLKQSRIADEQALREIEQTFALLHRGPDGHTVVERFVDAIDTLSAWDRRTLGGWDQREPIEGVFHVVACGPDTGSFDNLVDGIRYEVCSGAGMSVVEQLRRTGYVSGSLVAFEGKWMLTGDVMAIHDEEAAVQSALDLATGTPALVFRDPTRLQLARDVQRREAEEFATFFHAPYFVGTGEQVQTRLDAYVEWRNQRLEEGTEAWMRSYPIGLPDPSSFEDLGVTFHPEAGMSLIKDLGHLIDALRAPSEDAAPLNIVRGFLHTTSIDRHALHAVFDSFPNQATEMLRTILERPDFDWARDGEAALRELRDDENILPRRLPLVDRLVKAECEHPTAPILHTPFLHGNADFAKLLDIPPWDWPDDVGTVLRRVMGEPREKPQNRSLAIGLAATYAIDDPGLFVLLRSLLQDPGLHESLRAEAALAMAPTLEFFAQEPARPTNVWMKGVMPSIRRYLHELHADESQPSGVRQAALRASAHAPEPWHHDAVSKAYRSPDIEWRRLAVACMRHVEGFEAEILEALESDDTYVRAVAIEAAGSWRTRGAWKHLAGVIATPTDDVELTVLAIRALADIDPDKARALVGHLQDHENEEIAEAVAEVLELADEEYEDLLAWN